MAFFTNLFSPPTYEAFQRSGQNVTGFTKLREGRAAAIEVGDILICYMTKLSRWFGVLKVCSPCYVDSSPLFLPENDPYVVRFKVDPLVWLPIDWSVPIHEQKVWDTLSFTKDRGQDTSAWTGKVRSSLNRLTDADGEFLQRLMLDQSAGGREYPVDREQYERLLMQTVRRTDRMVEVSVPESPTPDTALAAQLPEAEAEVRESYKVQARLARIGEMMGLSVWLPRNDRTSVLREWTPQPGTLLNSLPLSYDGVTLQTVENIDVLWLSRRSIVRAFEVEHTTAIYSGILRMADLLALQPNMDIRLHIVAPEARREKVLDEIRRPVFSLLERGPLAECCTFLPYDAIDEVSTMKHLRHTSHAILDEYAESSE